MSTPGRTVVTLATATPGGGFPVFGQAFAEAIHTSDPSLEIRQRNTKGSYGESPRTTNIPAVEYIAVRMDRCAGARPMPESAS